MKCLICGHQMKDTKNFSGEKKILKCEVCGKEILVEVKNEDSKILLHEINNKKGE